MFEGMIGKKMAKLDVINKCRLAFGPPMLDKYGIAIDGSDLVQYTKNGKTSSYTVEGWHKKLAIREVNMIQGHNYGGYRTLYVDPKNVKVI